MSNFALLKEGYRRGILPENKIALYKEAVKRGLDSGTSPVIDISGEPDVGGFTKGEQDVVSKYGREALEMGGLVGGAMVGSGAGPAGAVAGGGLGYGMGKGLADRLDEFLGIADSMTLGESTVQGAKDVGTGMMFEAGGQSAGKVIEHAGKGLWNVAEKKGVIGFFKKIKEYFPNLSDEGILYKAKQILGDVRKDVGVTGEKTIAKSDALLKEMEITTQPTFAQKSGSTESAMFEQASAAKDRELSSILKTQDAKIGEEGLMHVRKQFPEEGSLQDVVEGVGAVRAELEQSVSKATDIIKGKVAELKTGKTVQESGLDLHSVLKEGKKAGKDFVAGLYAKIPKGVELDSSSIGKAINEVVKDYNKIGGGTGTHPKNIITQIRKTIKESAKANKQGRITFENLQDWSSQISQEIRDYSRGSQPNLKMVRRLNMLKEGVEDSMDKMLEHGSSNVVETYKTAKGAFVEYFNKFRAGTVGDVLKPGNLSTGNKVAFSDIPQRFFRANKMDVADDLVHAVGENNAKSLIEDYAGHDLVSKYSNEVGEISLKGGQAWLGKNKTVLKKYNLYDKFNEIIQSQVGLDTAKHNLVVFNKSTASKILNSDVEKIIEIAFGGANKNNSGTIAKNLLSAPGIKGNKTALDGIKSSFKDFLLKRMQNSGVDPLGNPLMSLAKAKTLTQEYLPAMKVLYEDTPKKIKAFQNYHKLLEMLSENKNVSFSGGSTTAEKLGGDAIISVIQNSAQLAAVHLKKGWFFSASKNLFKSILGAPGKFSKSQVESLLREAIYNPDVASTIMKATKPVSPISLQKEINNHLLTMGIYSSYQLTRE